jgi:hypothetical protein
MTAFVKRRELLLGFAATRGIAYRGRRNVSVASGPHPGRNVSRRRH